MAKKQHPGTRRHWTEADARRVLAELDDSGEPLKTFARARGLVPQRLEWWRKRLRAPSSGGAAAITLVPAIMRAEPLGAPTAVIRVLDGTLIELTGASPGWIAALARALARSAA